MNYFYRPPQNVEFKVTEDSVDEASASVNTGKA